jgi:hypothetical protein
VQPFDNRAENREFLATRRAKLTPQQAGLPRAGAAAVCPANSSVLTHLREDDDLLYLYHFLYETADPVTVEVALPGVGAVHRIDGWTGAARGHTGDCVRSAQHRPRATVEYTSHQ